MRGQLVRHTWYVVPANLQLHTETDITSLFGIDVDGPTEHNKLDNILSPNEPQILVIGKNGQNTAKVIEILERNRIPFRHASGLQRANAVAHMNPSISIVILDLGLHRHENMDLLKGLKRYPGTHRSIETLVLSKPDGQSLSSLTDHLGSVNLLKEPVSEPHLVSYIEKLSSVAKGQQSYHHRGPRPAKTELAAQTTYKRNSSTDLLLSDELQDSLSVIDCAAQNLLEHDDCRSEHVTRNAEQIRRVVLSLTNLINSKAVAAAGSSFQAVHTAEYDSTLS